MRPPTHLTLFDIEHTQHIPKPRDMTVHPATTKDVDEFCRRYHYTAQGGNKTWRYGLWHNHTLYGIVSYNLPTRETCESVFGPQHHQHVWHMGRLALPDIAPRNSESRLIAGSLKLIEQHHPHVWAIATYAATDVGHIGYVYQATNAIYTGIAGHTTYYTDPTGARRSDYLAGNWISPQRATELGWTKQQGTGKHRYLYILGNRRERRIRQQMLRWPTLPYPKHNTGEI